LPGATSGPVADAPGENWKAIDGALRAGHRGLAPGSSLTSLLRERRGLATVRPPLAMDQILRWADAHHARTGGWPKARSGPVAGGPGENWKAIDTALRQGSRGLPGGSSLSGLLAHHGREG
jgi:hypothetical protein